MKTLALSASAVAAALAATWFVSQEGSPLLLSTGSAQDSDGTVEVQIPTIERNGSLLPAPFLSRRQSARLVEETIGKKAANAVSADLGDARQWAYIGWNKPLHSPEYYLECGGIGAPSDDQLSAMQAILDGLAVVIGPIQEEFTSLLIDFSDILVKERGQYYQPNATRSGSIVPAPFNGSWQLYQQRQGFDGTLLVQIFPGEDAGLDAKFDELQAAFDLAFWEIGEFIKDCKHKNLTRSLTTRE